MSNRKMPGFRMQMGRNPIPVKDYNPNGDLSQDEHEYLTGTGAYSNYPEEIRNSREETEMNDTRNNYGMTEEEWGQYLAEENRREKQMQEWEDRMQADEDAKERGKAPTLAALKHLRPDLYW